MSKSMMGYVDRSVPVKYTGPVSVRQVLNRVYKDAAVTEEFFAQGNQSQQAFESDVFRHAVDRLDPQDAVCVNEMVRRVDPSMKNSRSVVIKHFGKTAVLEVMAKLGIWLNANVPEKNRL